MREVVVISPITPLCQPPWLPLESIRQFVDVSSLNGYHVYAHLAYGALFLG